MQFADFWYIVALSEQLQPNKVLARSLLGEWLAIFRDENGKAVALRDRCLHRNSRLSTGKVCQGALQCPYHGWLYDRNGKVIAVPAEGDDFQPSLQRQAKRYPTKEQDGYIYVRLADNPREDFAPFSMPYYGQPGWETVRVINRFANNVTNCAENFIDIPHTAFVHPGVFRTSRQQKLEMTVERENGAVLVEYRHETSNLGWYSRFLNRQGTEIKHCDRFYMPNITSVEYQMGANRHLFITSQSIPESDNSTLVYTDVTYNYGIWNKLARPLVCWTAQHIISQDIDILSTQGEVIGKYGTHFANTPADTIHVFVESIRDAIARGEDPQLLPNKSVKVTFWV
ncbi:MULTISPECIES: aromatic ring-hydroxylating dioxygenase subunit alpha [Calothrix]|uniref:Aromatic ring-hydroxylating dioxygenase subunit alpha n=2 Tax=Calothrix TaxID=1186 RepID=A0ABR8AKT8_9CYAN|nr:MULTISPECIES: aromatic ring-hydroxylating dioxygenase subunit alpha [Calothrix]MBD2200404.1 aromatic ring-hydroxylating dioxygenase subunit alpha [Calothrix parietina FACHB-288]MBD2229399.1 aromatic ring-hydroxylating dioxygenase subunit alpha [Calothrix anomala FACHB-343]